MTGPSDCLTSSAPYLRCSRWAPPVGFEPTHTAPEAVALSPELWGLSVRRTLGLRPQSEASHPAPNGRSNTTSAPRHPGTRRASDGPPQERDRPLQVRDEHIARARRPTPTGTPVSARGTPRGTLATGTRADTGRYGPIRAEHPTGTPQVHVKRAPDLGRQATELRALRGLERITSRG